MGFSEIVDIGSGDARIPYCGAIAGMRGISVELDDNLVDLQRQIIRSTGVEFDNIRWRCLQDQFRKDEFIETDVSNFRSTRTWRSSCRCSNIKSDSAGIFVVPHRFCFYGQSHHEKVCKG